jgi:hypothetical protein
MINRNLYVLALVLLVSTIILLIPPQFPGVHASETTQTPEIIINDLVFTSQEFQDLNASGLVIFPEGMTIDSEYGRGTYTSQPIQAPNKFNAVVPQWVIDQPESSELYLELRTGKAPSNLGEWIDIHAAMDWMLPEDEDVVGDMLVVPAKDQTHEYLQFRISLSRTNEQDEPILRELKLTFIDSTSGPTVEDMIRLQEDFKHNEAHTRDLASEEANNYPKPTVISRQVWCTHPDCNYSEGLQYQPVTHLILHHTVSGSSGDSAATVRAIWSFHTYSREWGDIGYNYLVDTNGVIFEGHLGGDDVVGTHASGANAGSMALAMIGTYTEVEPPDPMFESAAALFAWKADQKNIDVFDAGDTLPNIDWGLPFLMGHRDVYGTTQCPGDVAHALIPTLRDAVASRIGLVSPHIYIDELSEQFQKSNANWYVGPYQCGHNAHSWYTWSTTSPEASTNWAEWRPEIPESGKYRIEIYAPYCNTGASETKGAHYTVEHAQGSSSVIINQDERIGLWTSLGDYFLSAGNESSVHLDDLTETDAGRGIWFDAIRLLPIEVLPIAILESPTDNSWLNKRTFTFTWQIENPEKVNATVLQIATDSEFQNRIVNEIWAKPTYSASIDFAQDYGTLFWRVVLTSESNNEYPSDVFRFGIDTTPPTSNVDKLYWFERTGLYQVFWQGEDALVGIEKYNIDYRLSGEENWERMLSDTTGTNAFFLLPAPAGVYEFRSQAIDRIGNEEIAHLTADMNTLQAHAFTYAVLLPVIGSN